MPIIIKSTRKTHRNRNEKKNYGGAPPKFPQLEVVEPKRTTKRTYTRRKPKTVVEVPTVEPQAQQQQQQAQQMQM